MILTLMQISITPRSIWSASINIILEIMFPDTLKMKQGVYCIRTLPRGEMYWVVHPRRPRDFRRAEGNLEVGGDVQPNTSRFEAWYGHSLIINPSLGMYQEIHPYRAMNIDSVKINTSLLMRREWHLLTIV